MTQRSLALQVAATNRTIESGAALLQIGGAVLLQSRRFCDGALRSKSGAALLQNSGAVTCAN
jgi:hypothetical protein